MTTWDLNRLRYTIRKITGRYDTVQLPDSSFGQNNISNPSGIDDYINDFYLYDFPEHLRTLKLRDFYTFTTVPNCGTYSIPQNVFSLDPPIYFDSYQGGWYQQPELFYGIYPDLNYLNTNVFTTNGTANYTYTFTLPNIPILQGSVVIGLMPNQDGAPSPPLETFRDQDQPIPLDLPSLQYFVNPGTLTGNFGGTGTINYITGVVSLTYNASTTPPAGVNGSAHYHQYTASRPRDCLMYQQQLFLRPIPNDTYLIKVMSYLMPTTVISAATNAIEIPSIDSTGNIQGFTNNNVNSNPTNLPQFNEWWQLIAYGASLKIFIEDGDHTEYERYKIYFEEQKLLTQRKALKQLADQRIPTQYSHQNFGSSWWPNGPLY